MSVIKLAFLGAVGYLVYQNFIETSSPCDSKQESRGHRRGPKESIARRSPMTGKGDGLEMTAMDAGGATTRHRVGRGVV